MVNGKRMEKENKYMQTLIQNAQKGKIVAMEELFEININQVYTLVSRLAGNKLMAELLTKNILLRVWEKMTKNKPVQMLFSDWIREISVKITVNEIKNPTFLNDKKIKKRLKKGSHATDFSSDPTEKIIAELDLEHRITFVLSKIENYNLSEISNFIGITESEVKIKLSESIEKISREMSEKLTDLHLSEHWKNLQKVIEPDENILKIAIEEIKEIKTTEFNAEEEIIETERKEEIAQIEETFEKERKEKAEDKKKEKEWKKYKPTFNINRKILLGTTIPVVIIFLIIYIASSSTRWSVSILSGSPIVNDVPASQYGALMIGDVIKTDESSSATIVMQHIGRVKIYAGTSFKRLDDEYSGMLLYGKIKVNTEGAKENLKIKIPSALIKDHYIGSQYYVEIDDRGNSQISLKRGWLHITSGDDEIIIPQKYKLNILKGFGAGVPYYRKAESEYITLLDEYLFSGKKDVVLNAVIAASTQKETITLWNLLQRVNPGQREMVYNKLFEIAPHSDMLTKKDVLKLDSDKMQIWFDEIK